MFIIIIIIV